MQVQSAYEIAGASLIRELDLVGTDLKSVNLKKQEKYNRLTIMATVWAGSVTSPLLESLATACFASSSFPLRTRYHGLSGANVTRMKRGRGQSH